jgi:hypothetical protein
MTTLAAWVGADQRGPASLYLVADSRLTWGQSASQWDYGRKLFASQMSPDIAGYAGDVLFPTQVLGQFFESMDRAVTGAGVAGPEQRLDMLISAVERAAVSYPVAIDYAFSIMYGSRQGEFMSSSFSLTQVTFDRGRPPSRTTYAIPQASGLIDVIGTGADAFRDVYAQWQARDSGGTSRAVYSAFTEHLGLGRDPKSGGPPQVVGLIRKGPAKTYGVVSNGNRYFGGMVIINASNAISVRWHNDLFELCEPATLALAAGAQRQPRPKSHEEDLSTPRKRRIPLP